ncbi:MAG TPA: hypothetical protein ENI87_12075 [bacterium]|nr:hypothetical protein [bacterium]
MRAIVLLLATVVVTWPQWLRADWDGTEGRRVQIALEMLRHDSWMVPLLYGEPTWAKPPFYYWLLMLCAKWFGTGFVSLRLPSILAVFLPAWVGGELLRRPFGSTAGWLCALGIITSPLVVFMWPTAEIDPVFSALTGMSLWLLATGVARERRLLVLWSGVTAGLAFLTKGPPFFLFAIGAYLVWYRHRRMRFLLWHLLPLMLVVLAYFVPLWLWFVDPNEMLRIANEESLGRVSQFEWQHVLEIPEYWLRALLIVMPFAAWCFWEWRGARDARMSGDDLTLRMCSGAAVLAVLLFTFFPGRPTRYLLPNVMLFVFAVSPAVAHFYRHRGPVPGFARAVLGVFGVLGAAAMIAIPFVPRAGDAAVGAALVAAVLPFLVRTPRHVVLAALLMPIVASWTVGLERSLRWHELRRARVALGRLLRRECDALGASADLGSYGHIDSPILLASGLWPEGDEMRRRVPPERWVLHEDTAWRPFAEAAPEHVMRWRMNTPFKTLTLHERVGPPK